MASQGALLQWPLHMPMDPAIAKNDLRYYAARSSGSDTKGFYTGDSSYAVAMLFAGERQAAEAQLAFAFDHQLGRDEFRESQQPELLLEGYGHGHD